MKDLSKHTKIVALMIALAALSRLLPHPYNFTPIGAMALFGGYAFQNRKYAFMLPLAAMLLSDIFLEIFFGWGFHSTTPFVYGSFVLITFIGMFLRRLPSDYGTFVSITVAPMISAILFFTITNFGVWLGGSYGYSLAGLANCYVMAIPFFYGTVLGDVFYSVVLFGSYAIIKWTMPALIKN